MGAEATNNSLIAALEFVLIFLQRSKKKRDFKTLQFSSIFLPFVEKYTCVQRGFMSELQLLYCDVLRDVFWTCVSLKQSNNYLWAIVTSRIWKPVEVKLSVINIAALWHDASVVHSDTRGRFSALILILTWVLVSHRCRQESRASHLYLQLSAESNNCMRQILFAVTS